MESAFITRIHQLPTGVIGHVLTYIPRNDTAQIIRDAWKNGGLVLNYVRRYQIHCEKHRSELFDHLAPSVCGTNFYGDLDGNNMVIIRSKISIGEKIRLMKIIQNKTY